MCHSSAGVNFGDKVRGNRTPLCENSYKKTLEITQQPAACQVSPRPNSPSPAGSTTDSIESGLAHCISFISITAFTLILNVRTSTTIDLTTALAAFLTLMSIDRQFDQICLGNQIRQGQITAHLLELIVKMRERVMSDNIVAKSEKHTTCIGKPKHKYASFDFIIMFLSFVTRYLIELWVA